MVLFVGHFLHPVGALAVELFDKDDVGHCRGECGTVPVLLARRKPDDVPWTDFLDRPSQRCTRPHPAVTIIDDVPAFFCFVRGSAAAIP